MGILDTPQNVMNRYKAKIPPPRSTSNVSSTLKSSWRPRPGWSLSLWTFGRLTLDTELSFNKYFRRKLLWPSRSCRGRSQGQAWELSLFLCILLILITMYPDCSKGPGLHWVQFDSMALVAKMTLVWLHSLHVNYSKLHRVTHGIYSGCLKPTETHV